MTADLLALADWLDQLQVMHVAMESTGVYWWPVFNVLEDDDRILVVVNPQHMKQFPGHKTDVKDAEWIVDLLRHGLLRPSFIPPAPIRALRDLVCYRKTLVQQQTQEVNRLHKVLEATNIKLATVATDVMGMSGRDMLAGIVAGTWAWNKIVVSRLPEATRECPPCVNQCSPGLYCSGQLWPSGHKGEIDWDRSRERRKAIAQVADEGMTTNKNVGRCFLLESLHGIETLFQMPMVALDAVGEILRCPMLCVREHIAQHWRIALGLVRGHSFRFHAGLVDRVFEEPLCRFGVPPLREVSVDDLAILVDRSVNVRPLPV